MIKSKKIKLMTLIALIFSIFISIFFIIESENKQSQASTQKEVAYESEIFGTEIISLEIIADDDEWEEMLENAAAEEYIMADVIVNGTKFQNVGVRPKGNSSLTDVVNSDSDRYSFRIQFDEYIDDQTAFGLESLVVNNMIGDNTYMKEYISYDLMTEIGVDAPLFGYTDMKINGEDWGLYLAVELYDDSYEERVFNDLSGELYNVKNISKEVTGMETLNENQTNVGSEETSTDLEDEIPMQDSNNGMSEDEEIPMQDSNNGMSEDKEIPMQDSNNGMPEDKEIPNQQMEESESGGSLQYTDDDPDSYPEIFENVVGNATDSEFGNVVEALEALSEGEELETYFDVDQTLKYLAVHTFVVNLDSYSSSMAQNYYLYENDGQVTILPWDYNLAWGGFQTSDVSSVINFPIDTPVSDVDMSTRPLIEKLFENSEYLETYHSYLNEILETYFLDGQFEEKVNEIDGLISEYVENDATAFIDFEQYEEAVISFTELGNLRAESVEGQLNGTIPSTTEEQTSDSSSLIDAGSLEISTLGSMGGGNKGGEMSDMPDVQADGALSEMESEIDPELMKQAMDLITEANGEVTNQVTEELVSLGITQEQIEEIITELEKSPEERGSGGPPGNTVDTNQNAPQEEGEETSQLNQQASDASTTENTEYDYMQIGLFSAIVIGALFFVKNYKRKY